MTHEEKLKDFIGLVMFGAQQRIDPAALLERGLAYRKHKQPKDLAAAFKAGMRAGAGKVEREEMEVLNRLERVLRAATPADHGALVAPRELEADEVDVEMQEASDA